MHYSGDTKTQAENLYNSMRVKGVPAFQDQAYNNTFKFLVNRMIQIAKNYQKIQRHKFEGHVYSGMDTREHNQKHNITEICKRLGIRVEFTNDPKEYCVRLYSPKDDVYNTWRGKTFGYGIG